jgi:amino acid transporter
MKFLPIRASGGKTCCAAAAAKCGRPWRVLFMTIATAAPITAMQGNVPIAVGSGNGQFAPAGFMVATLILALFAIGYAQMARFITATGAFYGFISHGLGRIVGMASGVTVTMTYIVFEAALVGIFAFFCEDLINTVFSVHILAHLSLRHANDYRSAELFRYFAHFPGARPVPGTGNIDPHRRRGGGADPWRRATGFCPRVDQPAERLYPGERGGRRQCRNWIILRLLVMGGL